MAENQRGRWIPLGDTFNLSSALFLVGVLVVLLLNVVKFKMERIVFSKKGAVLPPRANLAEIRAEYRQVIGEDLLYKLSGLLMPAFLVVGFAWLVAFHFSIK
jgi:hypothetical protein